MSAQMRAVLEWLAERPSTAYPISTIADWLDLTVPKTQAAAAKLRAGGLVEYFSGDPGTWAITAAGLAEIHPHSGPSNEARYRMALEACNACNYTSDVAAIVNVALKGAPDAR